METTRNPTLKEIDELLAFLPVLYAEEFQPVKGWKGGESEDGAFILPYPSYDAAVVGFFSAASDEQWCDYEYTPAKALQMLKDDEQVKAASLADIKTMLTFCARGERFCDGHWGTMVKNGYVRKILERLAELKVKVEDAI